MTPVPLTPAQTVWLEAVGYSAGWYGQVMGDPALSSLPHVRLLLGKLERINPPAKGPYLEHIALTPDLSSQTAPARSTSEVTDDQWHAREEAWTTAYIVREFLTMAGISYQKPCRLIWQWEENAETSERRLRPISCRERDICPHCGAEYGRTQGVELHSLLTAALDRRINPLTMREPLAWHIVLTLPPSVQAEMSIFSEIAAGPALRRTLAALTDGVKRHLAAAFALPAQQLAAAVTWHYWHSERPLDGPHWHAHVIVPNARRDRHPVARRGVVPERRLDAALESWRTTLTKMFPSAFIPPQIVQHVAYISNNAAGHRRLRHLARYVSRHPMADLLAYAKREPALYSRPAEAVAAIQFWSRVQSLKTRRYLGYLHPGQRRAVGLVTAEPSGDVWTPVPGGIRRLLRWLPEGLLVSFWKDSREQTEIVPRHLVLASDPSPPTLWEFRAGE